MSIHRIPIQPTLIRQLQAIRGVRISQTRGQVVIDASVWYSPRDHSPTVKFDRWLLEDAFPWKGVISADRRRLTFSLSAIEDLGVFVQRLQSKLNPYLEGQRYLPKDEFHIPTERFQELITELSRERQRFTTPLTHRPSELLDITHRWVEVYRHLPASVQSPVLTRAQSDTIRWRIKGLVEAIYRAFDPTGVLLKDLKAKRNRSVLVRLKDREQVALSRLAGDVEASPLKRISDLLDDPWFLESDSMLALLTHAAFPTLPAIQRPGRMSWREQWAWLEYWSGHPADTPPAMPRPVYAGRTIRFMGSTLRLADSTLRPGTKALVRGTRDGVEVVDPETHQAVGRFTITRNTEGLLEFKSATPESPSMRTVVLRSSTWQPWFEYWAGQRQRAPVEEHRRVRVDQITGEGRLGIFDVRLPVGKMPPTRHFEYIGIRAAPQALEIVDQAGHVLKSYPIQKVGPWSVQLGDIAQITLAQEAIRQPVRPKADKKVPPPRRVRVAQVVPRPPTPLSRKEEEARQPELARQREITPRRQARLKREQERAAKEREEMARRKREEEEGWVPWPQAQDAIVKGAKVKHEVLGEGTVQEVQTKPIVMGAEVRGYRKVAVSVAFVQEKRTKKGTIEEIIERVLVLASGDLQVLVKPTSNPRSITRGAKGARMLLKAL